VKVPEFWKTGVAILVLGGLFSYYWFVERKTEPKPEGERERVTVLSLDKAKAREVTIAAAGEKIDLVKQGKGWKVTAPFSAPADGSAVDSILSSLEKLQADEVVTEKTDDLAQYGLVRPRRTVSARVEGAKAPLVVEFGAKAPDGSSVYAKKPGASKVYLVASWVESSFDKKPFDLRDRDLLHVKRDDVRQLEVAGPEGAYALSRTDAGEWVFTKPLDTRAGRWSVDGLLGNIEGLRMDSIAVENAGSRELARYGLEKPVRTLRLVLKDGATRSLELGSGIVEPSSTPTPSPSPGAKPEKPTKYYARPDGSGLVAVVPATLVDDLAKGMGELRAKRLLEVATYEVDGLDLVLDGTKKSYRKTTVKDKGGVDKTQWKRTAPDPKEVDTAKVEDALFKTGVAVASFIDQPQAPSAYGLDAPALKLTVKAKGESWIEVGKKGGDFFARRDHDSAVLKLDPAKAEELLKSFRAL
jgi:hypothetical protein